MEAVISLIMIFAASATSWDQEFTIDEIHDMDTLSTFKQWTQAFNRSYANIEIESQKYLIWLDNLNIIAESNSMNKSYKLSLNQFSDMTSDEFKEYIGDCYKPETAPKLPIYSSSVDHEHADIPDSVDWTTKGVVTPVKDQGRCGCVHTYYSCYIDECLCVNT